LKIIARVGLEVGQNGLVNEVLILAKLAFHRSDEPGMTNYYQDIEPALKQIDGFCGLGIWRRVDVADEYLAIYFYRDSESADEGLRAIGQHRSLAHAPVTINAPADVIRVRKIKAMGPNIATAPIASYLSMSVRTSEPGYGKELAEELERIFDELQFFPGSKGSFIGCNDSLEEEVVGLVTWNTEQDFRASLPKRSPYPITAYMRII
jgi:heme-degrading monooxygenase HmoA